MRLKVNEWRKRKVSAKDRRVHESMSQPLQGYDMEDAMVLNKSSVERGFKHGCVYKTELVNLRVLAGDTGRQTSLVFGRKATDKYLEGKVDLDGLPYIGVKVEQNDPVCRCPSLILLRYDARKHVSDLPCPQIRSPDFRPTMS